LRCITKQAQEFSKDISKSMIENDDFFTIPEISSEDQRISGNHLNLKMRNSVGHDACSIAMLPSFTLWT